MPSSYINPKCKVEDCLRVSIFSLNIGDPSSIRLGNQIFNLTTTNPAFGGTRYWFLCLCGRRVGVLYLPYYETELKCRHCHNLTYESRNLSGKFKAIGNPLSVPELEALSKQVKRIFYNGKPTKKYVRYEKRFFQFETYHNAWLNNFYKNIKTK